MGHNKWFMICQLYFHHVPLNWWNNHQNYWRTSHSGSLAGLSGDTETRVQICTMISEVQPFSWSFNFVCSDTHNHSKNIFSCVCRAEMTPSKGPVCCSCCLVDGEGWYLQSPGEQLFPTHPQLKGDPDNMLSISALKSKRKHFLLSQPLSHHLSLPVICEWTQSN